MTFHPPRDFRGVFRTDDAARAVYSEAAGIGRALPLGVAVPIDAEDVATIVRWARAEGHAVVPRGSGSSMAGGAIGHGVVLDLSRLRGVGDADADRRCIGVDAGITRGELDRKAMTAGLHFPVDPSSGEFCSIGGMVGTNAAGPHSLRHGSVRPWVLSIDCVFDDGTRATVRRGEPPPADVAAVHRFMQSVHPQLIAHGAETTHRGVLKDSSGYATARYAQTQELVDILVGSEGTLAVFTSFEVALMPAMGETQSLLVSFSELERAAEAAVASREMGAAACELLDRTFLAIASKSGRPLPVSSGAEAVLLVEVEAPHVGQAVSEANRLRAMYRGLGADDAIVSVGSAHEAELWSLRHAASPAIARMDPSLRSMQFIEDAAVPPGALADYVRGVRLALDRADTQGVIFGHAGDAHVHVNPLLDVSRSDWRERVERILLDVTGLVTRLRGTITGEHGDGRLRTPLLDRVWSAAERERFGLVKRAFDPANVFNPGVKVPLPNQKAIDVVKYDPTIERLPSASRAALDVVDRERGYARFRLDLL